MSYARTIMEMSTEHTGSLVFVVAVLLIIGATSTKAKDTISVIISSE